MMIKNKNEEKNEVIEPVTETVVIEPVQRGSRVKFVGTKSYSGLDISQYTGNEYKVKELSDDRAVLAQGAEVVAAVNIKDCVKV